MQYDTNIVFAEPNYSADTDKVYLGFDPASTYTLANGQTQGDVTARGQWAFSQIRLADAQKVSTGKGITVAVIDTGVSPHPSLTGKVLACYNAMNNSSDVTDEQGHGTFIVRLIIQIAPDAKILPVKVVVNANRMLLW